MKRVIGVGLMASLLLIALMASALSAQDEPTCDQAAAADEIATLTESLRTGDDPLSALREIRDYVSQTEASCSGLAFNSDDEGKQPVLGPFTLDEGLYRATVTTDGYFIGELEAVDGDCEAKEFGAMFALSKGQGEGGAQALIESDGCEALLSISNVSEDWTLTFEKLK